MKILFSAVASPYFPCPTLLLRLATFALPELPFTTKTESACRNLCMFYVFAKNKNGKRKGKKSRHATRIRHVCHDNDEVDKLPHLLTPSPASIKGVKRTATSTATPAATALSSASSACANINSKLLEWPLLS